MTLQRQVLTWRLFSRKLSNGPWAVWAVLLLACGEEKLLCQKKTSKSAEWSHGHLPCHGTATFVEGFPDVFSLATEPWKPTWEL
eukprot:Skav207497  [mRNA]  locus=scaffold334:133991:134242:- [translate_table: standard]